MKGIIMAGGEGTRLRPLTCDQPKPMVTVFDRPVMEYIISLLRKAGIYEIGVTLQYMPQLIMNYFKDGAEFGVRLSYFIEETPLGTAGSVKNAAAFLDEDFLVISGDCMSDFNLKDAIEFHAGHKGIATLVVSQVEEPLPYGVVIMDPAGRIERFVEKPTWPHVISDRVNTGIYVCKKEILDEIPKNTPYDFSKDLFKKLLEQKKALLGCSLSGYWCDIGDIDAYIACHFDLLSGRAKNPLLIPFTQDAEREFTVKGPCYIAKDVIVEKGAVIGPYASLEKGSVVKEGCKLARSVVLEGSSVGKNCEIKGALLCRGTVLKEGVSCFEGSVVGTSTTVEERAVIASKVKIWPQKLIEEGAAVTSDIVWGKGAKGLTLCDGEVKGEFNAEITADLCARLAFAAASLSLSGGFAAGCGAGLGASILKSAALAGGACAGAQTYDCGLLSRESFAFFIREKKLSFGLYVDLTDDCVTLSFCNSRGLPLESREEKEICAVLQKGNAQKRPSKYLHPEIKGDNIAHRHMREIQAEVKKGEHSLRVGLTPGGNILTKEIRELLTSYGAEIYEEYKARHAGLPVFSAQRGQFSLADEEGLSVGENQLFLFLCGQYHKTFPARALSLPPWAAFAAEGIPSLKGVVQAAREGSDSSHSRAALQNGLYSAALCLSFLSFGGSFKEEMEKIGPVFVQREEVYCPSFQKGRVMQKLIGEKSAEVPGCGGVQIPKGEGSVFITPHPRRPVCQIFATGYREEISKELCGFYQRKIERLQKKK